MGGGEYRAPVLLALMGRVRWSIAANLLIGVLVSPFVFSMRGGWSLSIDYYLLVLLLTSTSLPGAYVGAIVTQLVSTKALKVLLMGILFVTGLRLILVETHGGGILALGPSMIPLALLLGFGLGMISGVLGVAAGEYRIPALILLFGVPTVVAGTLSALCSIPVQLVGFLKHRHLNHTGPATYRLGIVMGAASILGVAVGVWLLGRTTDVLVNEVLGIAMIAAAGRIAWDIRNPSPAEETTPRDTPLGEEGD